MVSDGLIEVQDTFVVKSAMKERRHEPRPPHESIRKKARMMRIYLGEDDRWNDQPLYEAIVQRLRMMDISGATVHRGILGYGAKGHTHKEAFWHISRDLPIVVTVVDAARNIQRLLPVVEGMIDTGLIAISDVEALRIRKSGS
jgi:hypothetical protein